MQKTSPLLTSTVICRTHQGGEILANVIRLRRYSVTFEVYNPYTILQLSEVLEDFKIRVGDQIAYQGRAVVSGMVNTGILLVCEVTLSDSWLELSLLPNGEGDQSLGQQISSFVHDWKQAHQVETRFKLEVADSQNLLIGLQRWLEQIELGVRATATANRQALEKEVLGQVQGKVLEEVQVVLANLNEAGSTIPEGRVATHKSYLRRQLHPFFLCAPFVYRTFHKPLGYAGDYEMVNMLLRDPFEGGTLFAKTVNNAFVKMPPAEAHRNRIKRLGEVLLEETARNAGEGRRTEILNLGCGPAHEVKDFLMNEELSDLASFTLLDFNAETIDHARRHLMQARTTMGRMTPIGFLERSVHQLLRKASTGEEELKQGGYDLVYCAGLFDYLSQRVCRRLTELFYQLVRPGGLLVITNVTTANPIRTTMEFVLEWNLIHRDELTMRELVPDTVKPENVTLKTDSTKVNYFLEMRRPT